MFKLRHKCIYSLLCIYTSYVKNLLTQSIYTFLQRTNPLYHDADFFKFVMNLFATIKKYPMATIVITCMVIFYKYSTYLKQTDFKC